MLIFYTTRTTTTPLAGPPVIIDCPKCGEKNTPAIIATAEEGNRLLGFIPFLMSRWTVVECQSCGKLLGTDMKAEQIAYLGSEEISAELAHYEATKVDFLVKFVIIAGLLTVVFPGVPFILSGIGVLGTYKRKTGWRTAAYIGFALSIIFSIVYVVAIVASK